MASVTEMFGFSLFIHGVASCFQQELQRRIQHSSSSIRNALLPHWLAYTTIAEEDDEEFQAATNMAAAGPSSPAPAVQAPLLRSLQQQQTGEDLLPDSPPAAPSRHGSRASKLDVLLRGPGASIAHDQEASVQVP